MTNPYLDVRAEYLRHWRAGLMTWEELVGIMLASPDCYVFKQPDFFIMGRAVPRNAPGEFIDDLTHKFKQEECDAWHVWAIWGSVPKALAAMPYELQWCAIQRHGIQSDLRFLPVASIRRLSSFNA